MNIFKAIKLYNKLNKAYKASKKLIDSKEGLAKEMRKIIADGLLLIDRCAGILPEFKNTFAELKKIVKNAF